MTAVIRSGPFERLCVVGNELLVRLTGADTGGELSIVEFTLPPGSIGAAPHIHHVHTKDFVVIAGEVTFDLLTDGQAAAETVGAGAAVTVPKGVAHGFRNSGTAPARLIGLFRPAGYEQYFRDVHEMA